MEETQVFSFRQADPLLMSHCMLLESAWRKILEEKVEVCKTVGETCDGPTRDEANFRVIESVISFHCVANHITSFGFVNLTVLLTEHSCQEF